MWGQNSRDILHLYGELGRVCSMITKLARHVNEIYERLIVLEKEKKDE